MAKEKYEDKVPLTLGSHTSAVSNTTFHPMFIARCTSLLLERYMIWLSVPNSAFKIPSLMQGLAVYITHARYSTLGYVIEPKYSLSDFVQGTCKANRCKNRVGYPLTESANYGKDP